MSRYLLSLLLTTMSLAAANACSCIGHTSSFNLMDYDAADLIVEITGSEYARPVKRKSFDREAYRIEIEEARRRGKSIPPPPPPPPMNSIEFRVKVESVFKGDIEGDSLTLTTSPFGPSCGWQPGKGERYILYLYNRANENGVESIGVSLCSRKTRLTNGRGAAEIEILRELSSARDGAICGEQLSLLPGTEAERYVAFDGSFKDGVRHGEWNLYPAIYYEPDADIDYNLPEVTLLFDEGRIVEVNSRVSSETVNERGYLKRWMVFYLKSRE
ncbi:hypothetical protein FUA23_09200 [Neolewinella aurantiaca]|uniref:Secreted protein n=1 Tax=Neolewinella aurantiaca TaxID=2602767 RepID=A0A5C7FW70_9BACT|nr:hypothetical protein [Neolewinella aurantiaca]TXF89849.1 hypothetical protein FUA23_09200 [Neolewinella aurantiaca]